MVISPNLPRTVASSNQQLHIFSQYSLIVLIMDRPNPIGIRHEVLALAFEAMWQNAIALRGSDSSYRQAHPAKACRHWNFGVRQVLPEGYSEDHTLSRPRFVQDGPTESLDKCSCLDGVDEEFIWNERWPKIDITSGSCLVVTVPKTPQESPCWRPTTAASTWSGHRRGRT